MFSPRRLGRVLAVALAATAVLTACSVERSPFAPASLSSINSTPLDYDHFLDGAIHVCKYGGPAGTYYYRIEATGGGDWVLTYGNNDVWIVFDGVNPACRQVWTPINGSTWLPDVTGTVKITEVNLPDGMQVDSIVIRNSRLGIFLPTITGTNSATVTVDAQQNYYFFKFYNGETPPPPPPVVATCTEVTVEQGVALTPVQLTASGGIGAPYTFSATGLPAGLTLSSSGVLSGTATVSGTFSYTVTATDGAGNSGTSGGCNVIVNPPPPPPPPGRLEVCKVGGPAGSYTFHVDVEGGGPYTLPNGSDKTLAFDGSTPTCATMYVPADYANWPANGVGTVEVTETALPTDVRVQSITVTMNNVAGSPITNTTSTAVLMGFTDVASVAYVNELVIRPRPLQGCTPGYWKVKQHWDSWVPTGYSTSQLINTVFNVPTSYTLKNKQLGKYTLVQGLSFQGGDSPSEKAEILLRAAIAGLLNASYGGNLNYFLNKADLISQVNAALASGDGATMISLATVLDNYNNSLGGCPLN